MNEKWESLPAKLNYAEPYDELLARDYSSTYAELINRWAPPSGNRLILKTDLYDEALCRFRSFISEISSAGDRIVGMDISSEIVKAARSARHTEGPLEHYTCCDVRFLPFAENSFDLVISDSTLDHFESRDDIRRSLAELHRVLKPGGIMVLTLDNSSNFSEPLFRAWISLGMAPFYIGPTLSRKKLAGTLKDLDFTVTGETAIVHVPRFFGKLILRLLRGVSGKKFDAVISRWLKSLHSLEGKRIQYLTAQFIAVRAVKNA